MEPLTKAELRGIQEMRKLKGQCGTWNDGKARITWVWHGDTLKTLEIQAATYIGETDRVEQS